METKTSFDLSSSIQRWRENLTQSPAFRGEDINELESHLRDSITALQTGGLSGQEAFNVAVGRIGKGGELEKEFGKINEQAVWLDRMLWMLIGCQVWGSVSGLFGLIARNSVSVGLIQAHFDFATHGLTLPAVIFVLVQLLAIAGSLTFCRWITLRKGQSFGVRLKQLLHRRALLVGLCGCLISLLGPALSVRWEGLILNLCDERTLTKMYAARNFSIVFGSMTQTVTFIILIVILARKRLGLSKA